MWTAAETYLSENPVSAAPAVTGFSDKTGSLSEKNGISDSPVTVKQYYHVRILSYKITYSSYCLLGYKRCTIVYRPRTSRAQ